MNWRTGRIFSIDSVTEISVNMRNNKEGKEAGI